VAAAHNLVYRQRALSLRMVFDFLTIAVPAEIRRSYRPILLATLLMFGRRPSLGRPSCGIRRSPPIYSRR